MRCTAALALLPVVLAHPAGLECGTDATSRLKVGATIMGAPVVAGAGKVPPGGSGVEIMTTSDKIVEFKASSDVFFAIKAFGDGATLTCHEGFNNLTATGNCTSQIYTASALAKGPQFFICDHTKASGFAIGYGVGAAISVVTSTVPGTVNVQPTVAKAAAATTHYGDPLAGACMADEQNITIQGVAGSVCSPAATGIAKSKCPTDTPAGCKITPAAILQDTSGDKYCALECSPSLPITDQKLADSICGVDNMSCKPISGVGICTYDA